MAKGKSLAGMLKGSRPPTIGLTRGDNPYANLHPEAGQSTALKETDTNAPPTRSDDEQDSHDESISLMNNDEQPKQRPVDDKKRKSDRGKSRTQPIKLEHRVKPTVKPQVEDKDADIFQQGDLHRSQYRKNKKRGSMYGKQKSASLRSQGQTPNIHVKLPVKANVDKRGDIKDLPGLLNREDRFKKPQSKRSASPSSSPSQSKRQSIKLPTKIMKTNKDSDGSSAESIGSNPPKFQAPRPLKDRPKFNRPKSPRKSTRFSRANHDILKDGSAGPPNSQIRDKLSVAAGKLNVVGNEEVYDLLDVFKNGLSVPITIDDGSTAALDDIDLPDLPFVISSSASLPLVDSCTSSENHPQSSEPMAQIDLTETGEALCPFCKDAIDKAWLEERAPAGRLSVRQQAELCKAHKIHSAYDEWREKGYPDIAWDDFDKRLDMYHDRIEMLLDDNQSSYYRNVLEDKVRKGKNRTLRQALIQGDGMEGLVPGYYGTKGGKLIVDNIIARFSMKLRRLDRFDKLISAAGTSGYVQAVLAPEMAVMLVMDDMKTDEEGAREILRESVDIGNLLNEEEDETLI